MELMRMMYAPFMRKSSRIMFMDPASAELTKYAANTMLATRISFMNEVANLCEKVGADVTAVKLGIGTDSRIGMAFLNAGIGYGGSCFPKDVKALMMTGRQNGFAMEILSAVESVNDQQKSVLARKVQEAFGAQLAGKRIALLGLAFKPDTDDMREAPALVIARTLTRDGAKVVGYDPVAHETAHVELGDSIEYAKDWQACVKDADAILLVTEWRELRGIAPSDLAAATTCRLVFDGRNGFDPAGMRAAGFEYHAMGRP